YSQEILGFSNVTDSGTPTPQNDPIIFATSPTLTPFEDSDFLLFEEADAFLGLEDDPDSPKINPFYYDPEGDIILLEAILNKVELKDLPHHLEYAFLEGDNKLPVIIAKESRNKMLQRCEDTNLSLNWEKSHFMVKEGIVLGHKISKNRIEVDRAKVDVIAKLPHPTTVKVVLLTKMDGRQMPIHYVSRSLQGEETNYAPMEKLALSLVYTARWLRRAGLILIAPDDVEYSYALHLKFSNFNNDVECEALLAGLWIAMEMQVKDIHAFVDSKLVASQVEGSYEAKSERMIKYQEKVLELAGAFNRSWITHILRAENKKADALSRLAVVQFDHLCKEVLVEVLNERSVKTQKELYGVLYKRYYLVPLMRCVGPLQANYVIREVHIGSYRMHDGPRHVVAKVMNLGYYWPSMHRDAKELIRACDDSQAHAFVPRLLKTDMISITSDNIVSKLGIPATIITDNETQFVNDPFKKSLLRGIKTLEKGGSAWAEEVLNVLWAHRTMKTSNGETPFSLTYGIEVVILVEIGMPTHQTSSLNEKSNDQELRLNLDLLEEQKEIVAIMEATYKQQVEKYYNKKEKQFSKYRLALEVTLDIIDVLFLLA
nr:hypothetical protein [Tanacetum cinerariifolium]